jgi:hypothetical protein
MLVLGLNKQLDFQTLLIELGREIANRDGWYAQRRVIQAVFVFGCVVVISATAAYICYFVKNRLRQCGLACAGLLLLLAFIVIRAANIHHADGGFFEYSLFGKWTSTALEPVGTLLVALGALMTQFHGRSRVPRSGDTS